MEAQPAWSNTKQAKPAIMHIAGKDVATTLNLKSIRFNPP
jgi:hypothetical protein